MKPYYETGHGAIDLSRSEFGESDINRMRVFTPPKRSRTTTRRIDFRLQEDYFEKIVAIGKDLFVAKLPILEIAAKHQISRKTVWRYKKRLMEKLNGNTLPNN